MFFFNEKFGRSVYAFFFFSKILYIRETLIELLPVGVWVNANNAFTIFGQKKK